MPFIPHTEADIRAMLDSIGAASIDQLFDEIPEALRSGRLKGVPAGLTEMEVTRLMQERAEIDHRRLSFIGAGAYEHHIPAAVWQIASRGEFYSAYTPYQAEASQGTLQLLYEYQTMMASLTGLDVSNASLYDGATALAEAVLMAVRAHKTSRRVLVPKTVHPVYRKVVQTIVKNQGIEQVELGYCPDPDGGYVTAAWLAKQDFGDFAALVIPQPNFFGILEDVDALTDYAHAHGALAIAVVNPISLAVLKAPGEWGESGADIAVGEGQPLGCPLSSGGPYFGFMTCRAALVRQMPGRIIGRTVDVEGKQGFALTLQAREQHIRRAKATSNICTNQGLLVTAATIYLSIVGPRGLAQVAAAGHANATALVEKLTRVPGVSRAFSSPIFHEAVLRLPLPAAEVLTGLAAQNILGGFFLKADFPELGEAILVCATETKVEADLDRFSAALEQQVLSRRALPLQAQQG
jgi:glycine dehydrogenase subunit 1